MIRLAIRCEPALAERVLAELLELAPSGVEEQRGPGWVEYAVYGPPGELPELPDLEAAAGQALIEVSTTEIDDDWDRRWRQFHLPVLAGSGRIRVRPPWIDPAEAPGEPEVDVVIDPGRAFGTGSHATTRLCLDLLCELSPGGGFVDWGTGSGVLAIAAARLGFAPVKGVDSEPAALEAAAANAAANGVEIALRGCDLRTDPLPTAEVASANLTAPVLRALAARIASVPERPRLIVCSGLLDGEGDSIAELFGALGYGVEDRRDAAGWAALALLGAD